MVREREKEGMEKALPGSRRRADGELRRRVAVAAERWCCVGEKEEEDDGRADRSSSKRR